MLPFGTVKGALVLGAALLAVVVSAGIALSKSEKKSEADLTDGEIPEPTEVRARLVKKCCTVGDYSGEPLSVLLGHRYDAPTGGSEYALFFKTEDGCSLQFLVSEEEYLSAEEGTDGLLVYVNRKFMAFDTDADEVENTAE